MTNPVVVVAGLAFAGVGFDGLLEYAAYTAEQRDRVPVLSRLFVASLVCVVTAGFAVVAVEWTNGTGRNWFLAAAAVLAAVAVGVEWRMRVRMDAEPSDPAEPSGPA